MAFNSNMALTLKFMDKSVHLLAIKVSNPPDLVVRECHPAQSTSRLRESKVSSPKSKVIYAFGGSEVSGPKSKVGFCSTSSLTLDVGPWTLDFVRLCDQKWDCRCTLGPKQHRVALELMPKIP